MKTISHFTLLLLLSITASAQAMWRRMFHPPRPLRALTLQPVSLRFPQQQPFWRSHRLSMPSKQAFAQAAKFCGFVGLAALTARNTKLDVGITAL